MIIVGIAKYLVAEVHLKDGTQIDSGTMYAVIWRESDGKFWDGDSWETAPGSWPTGTYKKAAGWTYLFPTGASAGLDGDTVHYTYTNHMTPASATSVCAGGEHRVNAEDSLKTSDLSNLDAAVSSRATPAQVNAECDQALTDYDPSTTTELTSAVTAIRGSDGDDLKDISDELAAVETAIRGTDSDTLKTLSDQIDNVEVPTGSCQITIHIQDGVAAPIQGAQVSVYDATNTAFITRARYGTDSSGNYVVNLDPGTYKLRIAKSLYGFTAPETMVVTITETKTFVGTAFTAPTPSSPDFCVIYGTARDAVGKVAAYAEVSVYAITPQVVAGVVKHKRVGYEKTNSAGYFLIEIEKNTQVRFKVEGTDIDDTKTVPNAANQDLATW